MSVADRLQLGPPRFPGDALAQRESDRERYAAAWDESKVDRDDEGKFSETGDRSAKKSPRKKVKAVTRNKVNRYTSDDLHHVVVDVMGTQNTMGRSQFMGKLMSAIGFPDTAGDFKDAHFEATYYLTNKLQELQSDGKIQIERNAPFQVRLFQLPEKPNAKRSVRPPRRSIGQWISGKEHQVGEIRKYRDWLVERTADGYVASVGNALKIREKSLRAVLDRIDEADPPTERYSSTFDESKHPRADDGKFGEGGGTATTEEPTSKTAKAGHEMTKEVYSLPSIAIRLPIGPPSFELEGEKERYERYAKRTLKSSPGQKGFAWDESAVKRDDEGKFAEQEGSGKPEPPKPTEAEQRKRDFDQRVREDAKPEHDREYWIAPPSFGEDHPMNAVDEALESDPVYGKIADRMAKAADKADADEPWNLPEGRIADAYRLRKAKSMGVAVPLTVLKGYRKELIDLPEQFDPDKVKSKPPSEGRRRAMEKVESPPALKGAEIKTKNFGHTLWLHPSGTVYDIPTGEMTHHDWIAKHFSTLFPGEKKTDETIFATPIKEGWGHIRNHGRTITIGVNSGSLDSFKKRKPLGDIVKERIDNSPPGAKSNLMITYEDKSDERRVGLSFRLPDDLDAFESWVKQGVAPMSNHMGKADKFSRSSRILALVERYARRSKETCNQESNP